MIIFDNKQIYELVHVLNLNKLMSLFLYWNLSVSLLQWQVDDRSLQWASRLVSLLQWHLSSMRWSTYSHRSTHQWTWSNVHVQLVSLLQWHHSISHSESATIGISILHRVKKHIHANMNHWREKVMLWF